jgi:hypothetical protein
MSTEIGTLLVRTPGVAGGDLRIDGTGVTVKQVAVWFKQGYRRRNPRRITNASPWPRSTPPWPTSTPTAPKSKRS